MGKTRFSEVRQELLVNAAVRATQPITCYKEIFDHVRNEAISEFRYFSQAQIQAA